MRLLLIASLALAVFAASCGSDATSDKPTSGDENGAAIRVEDARKVIDSALVHLGDLSAEWSGGPGGGGDSRSNICGTRIDDSGYQEQSQTVFRKREGGISLVNTIAVYPDDRATTVLSHARAVFQSCSSWTYSTVGEQGGRTVGVSHEPLALPALGDDSIAYRLAIEVSDLFGEGAGEYVMIRRGNVLVTLSYASDTGELETGLLERVASRVVGRLDSALAAAEQDSGN